ncbi:hypothetical protein [Jiella mangrovi]|uniref:DUF420 domain-containing protein n=1 Tax=Jiella mangrovi TaxID=2821407 RepID=A0ABS4BM29_9HYPH|nr:hypothetical protein [Jiella mangrovi]MBP0617787.1 hypothetical protein [Jiella mangrovi]
MHFDLAHAIISAVLIFATLWILRRTGLVRTPQKPGWDWQVFVAIVVVMFIFNLIWPYGTS